LRTAGAILLTFILIAPLRAADSAPPCARLSFSAAENIATIEFADCTTAVPKVLKNDLAIVKIGSSEIPSRVIDFNDVTFQTITPAVTSKTISLRPTSASGTRNYQPADGPEYSGDKASVVFGATEIPVQLSNPVSHAEHTSHAGQANSDDSKPSNSAGQANSNAAFRFQYTGAYVIFPPRSDVRKSWWDRGLQQEYKLALDTTDRKGAAFTDDNSASASVFLPRFGAGSFLNRARFGTQASYSRALHIDDHNFDGKLLVEGWLPFFQTQTLFSKDRFASPPLSFSLGWGYRDQNVEKVHSHGTALDGIVTYHLYLFEQYRVDFEQHTIVNQTTNRPAIIQRTQHSWRASVLMSPKAGSAFSTVVSFENGHSGPVFTQLRQYFVGIGFQRLSDSKLAQ
jgi:hypothetical protein